MAKAIPTPKLVRTSHDLGIDYRHVKEDVGLVFAAEWRNLPVTVEMMANRYSYKEEDMTEWYVYARRATFGAEVYSGEETSGTARSRLSDVCKPLAEAWLASEAYKVSRRGSFYHAMRHALREARMFDQSPSRDCRKLLDQYRAEMSGAQLSAIIEACDAYDNYAKIYHAGGEVQ